MLPVKKLRSKNIILNKINKNKMNKKRSAEIDRILNDIKDNLDHFQKNGQAAKDLDDIIKIIAEMSDIKKNVANFIEERNAIHDVLKKVFNSNIKSSDFHFEKYLKRVNELVNARNEEAELEKKLYAMKRPKSDPVGQDENKTPEDDTFYMNYVADFSVKVFKVQDKIGDIEKYFSMLNKQFAENGKSEMDIVNINNTIRKHETLLTQAAEVRSQALEYKILENKLATKLDSFKANLKDRTISNLCDLLSNSMKALGTKISIVVNGLFNKENDAVNANHAAYVAKANAASAKFFNSDLRQKKAQRSQLLSQVDKKLAVIATKRSSR